MKIILDWQKRAIILFAVIVLIFSVILTVFAIREAERDKLIKQTEINQEQERIAASINTQVLASIRETEELSSRRLSSAQGKLNGTQLADVARRIKESENLAAEIFYVGRSGRVSFPAFKLLYSLNNESAFFNESSLKIEENQLFKSAETAEFKTRNYSLAISNYRQLMRSTSDRTSRALIMNRIARCYRSSGNPGRAIQTYKQIMSDYQDESSSDRIPYALIALHQMGTMFSDKGKKWNGIETYLELYKNLLEPKWSISRIQFFYYLKKVKDKLDSLKQSIGIKNIEENHADRWIEFEQIEKESLERMAAIETIAQKILSIFMTRKTDPENISGTFTHLSEKTGNKPLLISYESPDNQSIFGFSIDNECLEKEILPAILEKMSLREEFIVRGLVA